MKVLVVTNAFGGYATGDAISDPEAMAEILSGEHAHHVVMADHAEAAETDKDEEA